jgi:hypothetical protein
MSTAINQSGQEETWLSLSTQPTTCLLASEQSYIQFLTHDTSSDNNHHDNNNVKFDNDDSSNNNNKDDNANQSCAVRLDDKLSQENNKAEDQGVHRSRSKNRGVTDKYANYTLLMAARHKECGSKGHAIIRNGVCFFLDDVLSKANTRRRQV